MFVPLHGPKLCNVSDVLDARPREPTYEFLVLFTMSLYGHGRALLFRVHVSILGWDLISHILARVNRHLAF